MSKKEEIVDYSGMRQEGKIVFVMVGIPPQGPLIAVPAVVELDNNKKSFVEFRFKDMFESAKQFLIQERILK